MKNTDTKKLLATILVAISVTIASMGCSDSGDDTPKAKAESTIKCPNTDCKYTKAGNPESLSVVDTCPDCGTKLKQ